MATQVTVITGEGSTSYSVSTGARGPQGIQGPAGTGVTIDQTIIDGSTNAVAGNAVFDALALKAPTASPTFTGIVTAPRITGRCDGMEVLCKAGLAINAGQVVYVTGASGNNIIIGLAQANAELTSSKTIGISESTLAHNATGYVITEGLMTVSISAPTANEGDPIWLSPSTAGDMVFGVANKPISPNHMVYLGVVTRKTGNTVVEIYVKIQNGSELDELADVLITNPAEGQALMRGATSWQNRSIVATDISNSTAAGRTLLTAANAAAQITALGAETPAGAAAKDAALFRKTQTEVAFIGDSITEQNDSVNASTSYLLTGAGYPNWTAYHLKGRIRLLPQSKTFSRVTFGTSGFKIHQIRGTLISNFTTRPENEILGSNSPLATMLGRIAKRKVIVVDLSGANDVADTFTYTAAQVALKRKCLWEEMIVGGVLPSDIVAIALLPYGGSTTTAFADAINDISINDAASLGINWMPYPTVFKSAGAANSSYYRDTIHPNKIGAFLIGQALAAVLDPKVTQDEIGLPVSTSNRWLSPNPYVTGTQAVSGTRYSGNIATGGWAVVGSVLVNTSVALSKYTDSEGEWQRFEVTGTERDGGLGLVNNISTAIPAGTRYRLVARVRSTGFYNYTISCVQNSSLQAVINQEGSDLVASNPLDLPAFDGILYSPVMVAIGGLGIADVRFSTKGQGTLDIRQVGILRDDEEDLLIDDQGGSIVTRGFNNTPALPNFDCTVMISASLAITQALPDALTCPGRRYLFVRTDANATTITIDPSGSQTINGASTFVFAASTSQYQRLHVQAHAGNWIIIGA